MIVGLATCSIWRGWTKLSTNRRTDHADRITERPSRRRPAEISPATATPNAWDEEQSHSFAGSGASSCPATRFSARWIRSPTPHCWRPRPRRRRGPGRSPTSSFPTPRAPYLIQLYGGAAWRQPTHQTITHDVWQCLSGSEGHHDPQLTMITFIRTWWGASLSVADSCQVPASLATTGF